ncbi:putative cobinamide kinase [Prochlorococcus marinus str. MIT 9515]|uniref:Adenosylcobinamide kinase n=1 Tax=Prochlorococcus marinus (strain MIT 9515) TaxID=167542 RepID=A2BWJ0_PROM5|nr:bifunctional adenosylcobinamide kinase/adenosylcobinamide-phosphate guanylyltransferase [Prochlorococcus marinus]ABM72151.1 putative cobinamide kinase [Prochlorococcus marinus str. MIT 9515]
MENHGNNFAKVIFITGGTKSGKSEFAEYLGRKLPKITYIALSESRPDDLNWQKKILQHRKRRPKNWALIETNNLVNVLKKDKGPILIDSIGGFIMESIYKNDEEWENQIHLLLNLLKNRIKTTLIVGEQVGWSLVSEYEIGNKYIERLGDLQKRITRISEENWLTINGRAIKLDKISIEIPF